LSRKNGFWSGNSTLIVSDGKTRNLKIFNGF
jgi:hypothetical protein